MPNGVQVHSVLFRPDHMVEITYVEDREQSDGIAMIRTLVVDRKKLPDESAELEGFVLDYIDEALTVQRDPPDSIPSRE